jgi:hypothetical protein
LFKNQERARRRQPLKSIAPLPYGEMMFIHVTDVECIEDYQLRLTFNTGEEGVVDLADELYGEVFEPLQDKSLFRQVYLTARTIEWPNGADFAPEFLLTFLQTEQAPVAEPVLAG